MERRKRFDKRLTKVGEARVLDFLPSGRPFDKHPEHRTRPFIQGIEKHWFYLVEVGVNPNESVNIGEDVSLKPMDRRLRGRIYFITFDELTSVAQGSLLDVIEELVKEHEKAFVQFFNISGPITLKLHALELLPHIGKKTLVHVLEERKKEPFKSFEDIEKRVKIKEPSRLIAERILEEIKGGQKYYLFVEPPPKSRAYYLDYLRRIYELVES